MEEIHGWLDACTAFANAWTGAALYNREHGMTSRMLNVCKAHDHNMTFFVWLARMNRTRCKKLNPLIFSRLMMNRIAGQGPEVKLMPAHQAASATG